MHRFFPRRCVKMAKKHQQKLILVRCLVKGGDENALKDRKSQQNRTIKAKVNGLLKKVGYMNSIY